MAIYAAACIAGNKELAITLVNAGIVLPALTGSMDTSRCLRECTEQIANLKVVGHKGLVGCRTSCRILAAAVVAGNQHLYKLFIRLCNQRAVFIHKQLANIVYAACDNLRKVNVCSVISIAGNHIQVQPRCQIFDSIIFDSRLFFCRQRTGGDLTDNTDQTRGCVCFAGCCNGTFTGTNNNQFPIFHLSNVGVRGFPLAGYTLAGHFAEDLSNIKRLLSADPAQSCILQQEFCVYGIGTQHIVVQPVAIVFTDDFGSGDPSLALRTIVPLGNQELIIALVKGYTVNILTGCIRIFLCCCKDIANFQLLCRQSSACIFAKQAAAATIRQHHCSIVGIVRSMQGCVEIHTSAGFNKSGVSCAGNGFILQDVIQIDACTSISPTGKTTKGQVTAAI